VRLFVCVPTYNERENLERLVRALGDVLAGNELDANVLVIDDASPDGTGEIADRLAAELSHVAVLHRPSKGGLGPAYVAGFGRALAEGAELVLTMDADFSHDPADVPRLVASTADAGLVLGSRYVPGGTVRNWGIVRRAVSRGGCLYAQAVLGFGVRDSTSGFKCYRRAVLETIGLERITSLGYAFQIETVYRAFRAGFTVREVPIVFTDRVRGGSKMGPGIVAEAAVRVPALRLGAVRGRL